jgi:sialate O-acetylesterase
VVEVWTPNSTLQQGSCKYVGGNSTHDWEGRTFGPRPGGSLWNGMVAPFVNFTLQGALWYQVQCTVAQCSTL